MLIHPLKRKLILSNPLLFLAPIPQAATSKDDYEKCEDFFLEMLSNMFWQFLWKFILF